jgi:hypothetical protein
VSQRSLPKGMLVYDVLSVSYDHDAPCKFEFLQGIFTVPGLSLRTLSAFFPLGVIVGP